MSHRLVGNLVPARVNPATGLCEYFEAGACGSCTLMDVSHAEQRARAQAELERLIPGAQWGEPIVSEAWGFRSKAKMAVRGTAADPVLTFPGRTSEDGEPTDLADCPLYPALVTEVLESCRALLRRAQIAPYDPVKRRGDAKYVLVTASDTEALVRIVLRTPTAIERLREHAGILDPRVVALSANIHPEHSALLEGSEEIPIAGARRLRMPVGPVSLGVLPKSFTQTNTPVAARLYAQAARWVLDTGARSVWDLFCGVGGFALTIAHHAHTAGRELETHGVEITPEAIESARATALDLGLDAARFTAAHATEWAMAQPESARPDALVVNPPRRGIGSGLASWINDSGIPTVVYSSCNPLSLASDIALMPAYRATRGHLVDMFPHTPHNEAIVLLERCNNT